MKVRPERNLRFEADVVGERRVELLWRGQRVHRAEHVVDGDRWIWRHDCEDSWDNCVDQDLLAFEATASDPARPASRPNA